MSSPRTDNGWPGMFFGWFIATLIIMFVTFIVWGAISAKMNHDWSQDRALAHQNNPALIARNSLYSMLAGEKRITRTEEGFFAKVLLPYRTQVVKSNNNVQLPASLINLYFAPGMYPDVADDTNVPIFGLAPLGENENSGTLSQTFLNDLRSLWSNNPALVYRMTHSPLLDFNKQARVLNLGWFWWFILIIGIIQLSFAIAYLINFYDNGFTTGWSKLKGNNFPLKLIALLLQPLVLVGWIIYRLLNSHWLLFNK